MDFLQYENYAAGVKIAYPAGWTVQEGLMGAVATFASPQESAKDIFLENVGVHRQDLSAQPELDLELFTQLSVAQVRQLINKSRVVEPPTHTTLSGLPAHRLSYTGKQGKFKLQWYQVFAIKDHLAYVLTFCAEQKSYKKFFPVAQEMFDSFQILQ